MTRLLKSFYYKLFHDATFKITAIIGVGLAVILTVLYLVIDYVAYKGQFFSCTGAYALINSFNPVQNYGLAIPINLIIFISLLFAQGIIRNEIIVGNSKAKVYLSLIIGGVSFALILVLSYTIVCVILSTIIGGFYPSVVNGNVFFAIPEIIKFIVIGLLNYIFISIYSIFIATLLRNSGASIPLTIIPLVVLSMVGLLINTIPLDNSETIIKVLTIFNPLQSLYNASSKASIGSIKISDFELISTIINNIVYSGLLVLFGTMIFKKRDIK